MINKVELAKKALKDIRKLPRYIVVKLTQWVELVENDGLEEARKIKGFHDEPLKGTRKGQRSIRLSKHYRAIYVIRKNELEFVEIQEVNKHEY